MATPRQGVDLGVGSMMKWGSPGRGTMGGFLTDEAPGDFPEGEVLPGKTAEIFLQLNGDGNWFFYWCCRRLTPASSPGGGGTHQLMHPHIPLFYPRMEPGERPGSPARFLPGQGVLDVLKWGGSRKIGGKEEKRGVRCARSPLKVDLQGRIGHNHGDPSPYRSCQDQSWPQAVIPAQIQSPTRILSPGILPPKAILSLGMIPSLKPIPFLMILPPRIKPVPGDPIPKANPVCSDPIPNTNPIPGDPVPRTNAIPKTNPWQSHSQNQSHPCGGSCPQN